MIPRWLLIALIVVAQNAPALSRLGLDVTHLCRAQGVEVVYLDATGQVANPVQAPCECLAFDWMPADGAIAISGNEPCTVPPAQAIAGFSGHFRLLSRGPPSL